MWFEELWWRFGVVWLRFGVAWWRFVVVWWRFGVVWSVLECYGVVWGVAMDRDNSEWQGDFVKISVFFTGSDQY